MAVTITVPVLGAAHDAAFFQPAELTSADLFVTVYTDGTHAYRQTVVAEILAAGKGVLLNHENAANQLLGGAAAGRQAAAAACAAAVGYGAPQNGTVAVFYSVDVNVPAASYPVVAQAFVQIRAVHGGRFLVGFYGQLALYKYLKNLGLVDVKCWLSGSSSFPGYNPNDPDVGLIQLVGTDIPNTDRDLITSLDLGVWWPTGLAPSGGGTLVTGPTDASIQQDVVLGDNAALLPSIQEGVADARQILVNLAALQASVDSLATTVASGMATEITELTELTAEFGATSLTDTEITSIANAVLAQIQIPTEAEIAAAVLDLEAERLQS